MSKNLSEYHEVVSKIINLLSEKQAWYETFEHEPVRTSEEAAKVRSGYTLAQGSKAIIIKAKISADVREFIMLIVPGDKKFDNKKVKKVIGAKDITFASEQDVADVTGGVKVGGVPPFGNLFGLEVYADPTVFENEKIIFNAGDRSFSIGMKSKDYIRIVNPKVAEIV